MQNRRYFVAGEPLLTHSYREFMQQYDIALYDEHPITVARVRAAMIDGELEVHDSIDALKAWQEPVDGPGFESYERPTFRVPIFTIYIPDSNHIQSQGSGCYKVQRKNVVIDGVNVCGESYTSSFYPSAYHSFVKANGPDEIVAGIKKLIRDYAHPRFGLFLTLHWNRHYTVLADKLVSEMPDKVQDAYDYLLAARQKLAASDQTNLAGSFMRRIDFAIGKLITEMNKNNEAALRVKR